MARFTDWNKFRARIFIGNGSGPITLGTLHVHTYRLGLRSNTLEQINRSRVSLSALLVLCWRC